MAMERIVAEVEAQASNASAPQSSGGGGGGGLLVVRPDMVGTIVRLDGVEYYIDVFRFDAADTWLPALFDENGRCIPLFNMSMVNGRQVRVTFSSLHPPKNIFSFEEFAMAEVLPPREAYDRLLDVVGEFVEHRSPYVHRLVVSWSLASWLHNLVSKKPNIYVTGFFGTGKSVIAQIVRRVARYAVDLVGTFSASVLWNLGVMRGVLVLDETDRLSASVRMMLRRMHDAGVSITKMIADELGWHMYSFEVSSPILFVGTHLPEDPALLSRGFILKMHYGKPRKRAIDLDAEIKPIMVSVAKTMILHWKRYIDALRLAKAEVDEWEVHERYKDIVIPLIAVEILCRKDWGYLEDALRYASTASFYQLKANRAIGWVVEQLYKKGHRVGDMVVIKESEFRELARLATSLFGLSESDARYVYQYFVSASEPCMVDDEPGICLDVKDVVAVRRLMGNAVLRFYTRR